MSRYVLTPTLIATIEVEANSLAEAVRKVRAMVASSSANLGTLEGREVVVDLEIEGEVDGEELDG